MKDTKVAELIAGEEKRQAEGLELIPSENYVSRDVLTALGSVFTNKYSEGYPGKRYYGGQQFTDPLEQLAIDRAKQIFGCDHANVQPHSGAQANEAAYHAWLEPGDTVLAMALDQGGHLTHGHPVTVLARQYNFVRYGMKSVETGELDFDAIRTLAKKHRPKIILAGHSSYPRELDYEKFAEIAKEVDAVLMADIAHLAGLIAGGAAKNPFDYGFHVVTSTTHKTLRGPRGGLILSRGTVSNPLKSPEQTVENLPTIIDRTVFPGIQGGPHMNVIAAKAVAFGEALDPSFCNYATQIIKNSQELARQLMDRGCKLITNGTDNHLMLVDVQSSFSLNGKEAEEVLDVIGLNVNKNAIPEDQNPPFSPSGIRLGTPALTTRGLAETHMALIAEWIVAALQSRRDSKKINDLKQAVAHFCRDFPLPR